MEAVKTEAINLETAKQIIEQYIYAKDYNRPHQMSAVFHKSAVLEMRVNSDSIAFPPVTHGADNIADILSRQFGATYDNVYTLCLDDSVCLNGMTLDCRWLVVMTHKSDKSCRIGFGSYEWSFSNCPEMKTNKLAIIIDDMFVLEPINADSILSWVSRKPYPWCHSSELLEDIPAIAESEAVKGGVMHSK